MISLTGYWPDYTSITTTADSGDTNALDVYIISADAATIPFSPTVVNLPYQPARRSAPKRVRATPKIPAVEKRKPRLITLED